MYWLVLICLFASNVCRSELNFKTVDLADDESVNVSQSIINDYAETGGNDRVNEAYLAKFDEKGYWSTREKTYNEAKMSAFMRRKYVQRRWYSHISNASRKEDNNYNMKKESLAQQPLDVIDDEIEIDECKYNLNNMNLIQSYQILFDHFGFEQGSLLKFETIEQAKQQIKTQYRIYIDNGKIKTKEQRKNAKIAESINLCSSGSDYDSDIVVKYSDQPSSIAKDAKDSKRNNSDNYTDEQEGKPSTRSARTPSRATNTIKKESARDDRSKNNRQFRPDPLSVDPWVVRHLWFFITFNVCCLIICVFCYVIGSDIRDFYTFYTNDYGYDIEYELESSSCVEGILEENILLAYEIVQWIAIIFCVVEIAANVTMKVLFSASNGEVTNNRARQTAAEFAIFLWFINVINILLMIILLLCSGILQKKMYKIDNVCDDIDGAKEIANSFTTMWVTLGFLVATPICSVIVCLRRN